ncbi:extracellular solute-binding protein [Paenibacillus sp. IB182496]|uniref:Extracellular solute-binding protein n=1 Tax=Paenibacillus sabuli TaxID=2772509 RepID=A0A927BW31_9BACL|nr:extracellular solute-binding protein [Paenibacillus sabuli]MBD2847917.1 extracellular solute-binding protein [Paenibacillus sabuli]
MKHAMQATGWARGKGVGAAVLALLLATACSNNGGEPAAPPAGGATGTGDAVENGKLSADPVTFKWLVTDRREAPVSNDWQIFDEIYDKTNVQIEFEPVPQDGAAEKQQIMIATNSVTDLMSVSHADARLYGAEGVFLDLAPYLDTIAPNMKAFFEQYPDARALASGEDEGIYSLPVVDGLGFNYNWIVRQDLKDEYGLETPDSPESFYEFLKALKQHQPDTYPLITAGVSGDTGLYTVMLRIFTGIEGYLEIDPDSGEYVFAPDRPGFEDALQFMRQLYDEQLLDPEFAIVNGAQWEERMLSGKSLVTYHWKTRNQIFTDRAKESGLIPGFDANAMPEFAAEGITPYQYSRNIISGSGLAISAKVKHKEAAVKFLDYLLSEEGSDYVALGIEGETYDRSEGEPKFLASLGTAPYDLLRGKWGVWYPGINPDMDKSRKAERLSEKAQAIEELYMPLVVPSPKPLVLSEEENALRQQKLDQLNVYIEEKMTEFVTGRTSINEQTLQEFQAQCVKLGAHELRDMFNAANARVYGDA